MTAHRGVIDDPVPVDSLGSGSSTADAIRGMTIAFEDIVKQGDVAKIQQFIRANRDVVRNCIRLVQCGISRGGSVEVVQ